MALFRKSTAPVLPQPHRSGQNNRGQASLMVAIMMMTFLFFFCFVVNVGMLVNAKIQLQNAADLAAYAGAATQARQLNRISFLNYEMRRVYKKFLFRYYVLGNMAQKGFPTNAGGGTAPATRYDWSPNGTNNPKYGVPAVCLVFNSNDNYCQVQNLPAIKIPPASGFDAINDALRNQLRNLERIRTDNCAKIATTNLLVLDLWLYKANPDQKLDPAIIPRQLANAQDLVNGLVRGLGLVPRELILRERIETLKSYLNVKAQSNLTHNAVESLRNSSDPHKYERSIQAFLSAFNTLGNHTFLSSTISMDEVQSDLQLDLQDIKANFDTYAIYFDSPLPGAACEPHMIPQTMKQELTLGVSKNPKVLTYYAVKLKAKAKLLFNPWGSDGIELKAYAAAQPFGSRIGPNLTSDAWVRKADPTVPISPQTGAFAPVVHQVPNLPITKSDSLDLGWNTTEVLGSLINSAFPSNGAGPRIISETDLGRAYQLAMAPNFSELGLYNIPNDLAPYDPGYRFSPGIFDDSRSVVLWAPVAPPDNPGGVNSALQSVINDLFLDAGPDANALKDTIKQQLSDYINSIKGKDLASCGQQNLAQGLDDSDCESFNMVRLTNPFAPRPLASGGSTNAGLLQLPPWFMPTQANQVLTSWNRPSDTVPASDAGRLGYSVKFVSFDSLINKRVPADATTQTKPDNTPGNGDEEAQQDMLGIQH